MVGRDREPKVKVKTKLMLDNVHLCMQLGVEMTVMLLMSYYVPLLLYCIIFCSD